MTESSIGGLGVALPLEALSNTDLATRLDVTEEWIESRTGISSRRVAAAHETTSTLGTAAGLAAIADARIAVDEIDLVICATVTPDQRLPATACAIQAALGIDAAAFDLNAACSGFLFALAQADSAIRANSARGVLVVGADVMSRITDPHDAKTAVLFGDGAGAAVVVPSKTGRLGPFTLRSDGSRPDLLYSSDATGFIRMEGREVYRAAVDAMANSVRGILAETGFNAREIDLLIAHQANQRILDAVALRINLDPQVAFSNIGRYGNTSAASIPIALFEARAQGRLRDDSLVVLTAFGAGFTWGAALLRGPVGPNHELDLTTSEGAHA